MTSAAAKKAWLTRKKHHSYRTTTGLTDKQFTALWNQAHPDKKINPARRAVATMRKGRRIQIHSPTVKVNGHSQTTYAPPKKWWNSMTQDPHGSEGKPLSAAAAGHLWFKVYDNDKRLAVIKQYG